MKKTILALIVSVFAWMGSNAQQKIGHINSADVLQAMPEYKQMLEDLVLTAANQALAQAKEISTAEMGKVTAGFNLPGLG